ncbi:hypothetical protein PLICRDRAFT_173309 [Plicaturopsis crispa FD-325 SS-3]|nr:hypothetical protein PLICRDRAFT_173309 [Plicaturopsis crispa FD-325 SS-3]
MDNPLNAHSRLLIVVLVLLLTFTILAFLKYRFRNLRPVLPTVSVSNSPSRSLSSSVSSLFPDEKGVAPPFISNKSGLVVGLLGSPGWETRPRTNRHHDRRPSFLSRLYAESQRTHPPSVCITRPPSASIKSEESPSAVRLPPESHRAHERLDANGVRFSPRPYSSSSPRFSAISPPGTPLFASILPASPVYHPAHDALPGPADYRLPTPVDYRLPATCESDRYCLSPPTASLRLVVTNPSTPSPTLSEPSPKPPSLPARGTPHTLSALFAPLSPRPQEDTESSTTVTTNVVEPVVSKTEVDWTAPVTTAAEQKQETFASRLCDWIFSPRKSTAVSDKDTSAPEKASTPTLVKKPQKAKLEISRPQPLRNSTVVNMRPNADSAGDGKSGNRTDIHTDRQPLRPLNGNARDGQLHTRGNMTGENANGLGTDQPPAASNTDTTIYTSDITVTTATASTTAVHTTSPSPLAFSPPSPLGLSFPLPPSSPADPSSKSRPAASNEPVPAQAKDPRSVVQPTPTRDPRSPGHGKAGRSKSKRRVSVGPSPLRTMVVACDDEDADDGAGDHLERVEDGRNPDGRLVSTVVNSIADADTPDMLLGLIRDLVAEAAAGDAAYEADVSARHGDTTVQYDDTSAAYGDMSTGYDGVGEVSRGDSSFGQDASLGADPFLLDVSCPFDPAAEDVEVGRSAEPEMDHFAHLQQHGMGRVLTPVLEAEEPEDIVVERMYVRRADVDVDADVVRRVKADVWHAGNGSWSGSWRKARAKRVNKTNTEEPKDEGDRVVSSEARALGDIVRGLVQGTAAGFAPEKAAMPPLSRPIATRALPVIPPAVLPSRRVHVRKSRTPEDSMRELISFWEEEPEWADQGQRRHMPDSASG